MIIRIGVIQSDWSQKGAMAWCHCHPTKKFVTDEWLQHSQGILNTSAHDAHATYTPIADAVQEYISARTAWQITSLRRNHILKVVMNSAQTNIGVKF